MKGPSDPLTLASQDPNTTVLDLKTHYARESSHDLAKIKLLYNKRPASDLKTLAELLPSPTPASAEFSVMILGGPTAGISTPPASTPDRVASPAVEVPDPAAVPSKADREAPAPLSERAEAIAGQAADTARAAADVLRSEQFWLDLKDFLVQRLRDEEAGEKLLGVFRSASSS